MRVRRTGSSGLRAATISTLRGVPALSLRRAEPKDADAIADVFLAARKASMPYLPDLHSDDDTRSWIRDVVLARDEVWVAAAGDRIDGFLVVHGDVLEHLYVAPRLHGGGVGSALFAKAKQLRPQGFRLWVFSGTCRRAASTRRAACASSSSPTAPGTKRASPTPCTSGCLALSE